MPTVLIVLALAMLHLVLGFGSYMAFRAMPGDGHPGRAPVQAAFITFLWPLFWCLVGLLALGICLADLARRIDGREA